MRGINSNQKLPTGISYGTNDGCSEIIPANIKGSNILFVCTISL